LAILTSVVVFVIIFSKEVSMAVPVVVVVRSLFQSASYFGDALLAETSVGRINECGFVVYRQRTSGLPVVLL
jgi:hypothetical protein